MAYVHGTEPPPLYRSTEERRRQRIENLAKSLPENEHSRAIMLRIKEKSKSVPEQVVRWEGDKILPYKHRLYVGGALVHCLGRKTSVVIGGNMYFAFDLRHSVVAEVNYCAFHAVTKKRESVFFCAPSDILLERLFDAEPPQERVILYAPVGQRSPDWAYKLDLEAYRDAWP